MKRIVLTLVIAGVWALAARADSVFPQEGGSMFADNTAYRAGDVVTVIVTEESKVSSSAGQSTSKSSETSAEIKNIDIPGAQLFPAGQTPKIAYNSDRSFDGKGTYTMQGTMETRLTAVVREVLPNGNLLIEGSRVRQTVDENITVKVSGIVRPQDVRSDNTVLSSALAEGKILFETNGPIQRSTRRGFLDRVIDFIWPF